MRDDSPYYEPSADTPRRPPFELQDTCAACGSTDDLGPDMRQDYTLCRACRKEERDFERDLYQRLG